jgi:sulfur carrier protein ThiS
MITVHLHILGYFQMILGSMDQEVTLPAGSSAADLWDHLTAAYRQLQNRLDALQSAAGITVNHLYIPQERWGQTLLSDGDRVVLVSQMGGG